MSKIICDVCGTTYAETADQCPICGCAKPDNPQVVTGEVAPHETTGTYTYVKGGRFSKANVAKRNKAMGLAPKQDGHSDKASTGSRSSSGLVIALIVLVLAIVAAVIFIVSTISAGNESEPTTPVTTTEEIEQTITTTAPTETPCTDITIPEWTISFDELGNSWLLNVTLTPEDTTDEVKFESADPSVATVTDEGRVTAIGAGQTTITIACGEVTKTCMVVCNVETVPTTEETVTEETEPEDIGEWDLNREDFTLASKGSTWKLFKGTAEVDKIKFTSDDETVATFVDGVVTAVGPGHTKVHAEYGGKKVSCIVRVEG